MVSSLILLGLGLLVLLAGYVIYLVDAFRVHIGWGLTVLLIPGAALIFLFLHWAAARRGFLIQLAGLPFVVAAVLLLPKDPAAEGQPGIADRFRAPFAAVAALENAAEEHAANSDEAGGPSAGANAPPVTTATPPAALSAEMLEARWDANRQRFLDLQITFMNLEARRNTLEVRAPAAVKEFNTAVAAYAEALREAQRQKAELLEDTRASLENDS